MPASRPVRIAVPLALTFVLMAPALLATAGNPPQVPCTTQAAGVGVLCPDLVVDPNKLRDNIVETRTFSTTPCGVREGMVPSAGTHKLLRFTFTTPNIGTADLVIGRPSDHPEWFVYSSCHNHYHFREYADYRLWKPEGYALWVGLRAALPTMTAQQVMDQFPLVKDFFVAGNKQGFCVIDLVSATLVPLLPRKYLSCSSNQGISVGWADEYVRGLDGQWIVIDNVAPGPYMLEAEVNAEHLYDEKDYANNAAAIPVTL